MPQKWSTRRAVGALPSQQVSLTVDHAMDPGATRPSQRAEQLAAKHRLSFLEYAGCAAVQFAKGSDKKAYEGEVGRSNLWIPTTNSKYVVKGVIE